MKRLKERYKKNTALRFVILAAFSPSFVLGITLVPLDKLPMNVAIGLGMVAGAIVLTAAITYIKVVHWSYAGLWTIGLVIWDQTESMYMLAAVWTVFAGAAVGMALHLFNILTEKKDEDQRRAALLMETRGLAVFFYAIAQFVSFETSMGASLAFLLGSLLPALIGFSYLLHQQEIRLGLIELEEGWVVSAFLTISLYNIASSYLNASASPPLAKVMLGAALVAASVTLMVAFQRMEEGYDPHRRLQARQLKRELKHKRKRRERMLKQLHRKDD